MLNLILFHIFIEIDYTCPKLCLMFCAISYVGSLIYICTKIAFKFAGNPFFETYTFINSTGRHLEVYMLCFTTMNIFATIFFYLFNDSFCNRIRLTLFYINLIYFIKPFPVYILVTITNKIKIYKKVF